MATHLAFKRERKAFGVAMTDRETIDGELAAVQDSPLRQREELQGDGHPSLAPEPGEHLDDDPERRRATVDRHRSFAAAAASRIDPECRARGRNVRAPARAGRVF